MLFQSSSDPYRKSTQELIVLRHGEEHVLVPVPESYEEALELAQEEFKLHGELRFVTQDLAGSDGQKVKIHKDAWKGIINLLNSMAVESVGKAPMSRASGPSMKLSSRGVSAQDRVVPRASLDSVSHGNSLPLSVAPAPAHNVPLAPVPSHVGPPTPASSCTSSNNMSAQTSQSDKGGNANNSLKTSDDVNESMIDEEMDEDSVIITRFKGKDTRLYLDEEEEDELDEPKEIGEEIQSGEDPKGLVELQDVYAAPAGSSVKQDPAPAPSPEPKSEPKKEQSAIVSTKDSRQSSVANQRLSFASQPQERSQPEEKFVISIEYLNGANSADKLMFKTRGRHTVAKVLLQACRTFGLEHLYDSARLVLILPIQEGDGEWVEEKFLCDPEDTMSMVGAGSESRFAIEVGSEIDGDE
ncbi:uncharacterized protein FIBRA_03075 [Fibroporia radiculosa]|uniref:Uncharacterized protein n=1 Tax=Fibroporia radiculosa TaxID=599839 RepID=J4HVS6_9APHY|nr:uncharacterized protein FIBRA_03075 [Fibroporia radiculosa]CCM01027.1 predicted protein [Fibroporia radiculosa]